MRPTNVPSQINRVHASIARVFFFPRCCRPSCPEPPSAALLCRRYKDLVGSHAAKINRITLRIEKDAEGRRRSPTCLHLCPTTPLAGLCSGCFLVGDAGGGVGLYGPDGLLRRHATWNNSAVAAVALLPTRRGARYRVATIGSDDSARLVLADPAQWKKSRQSEPVKLGMRGLSHSRQFGLIVTAGAVRRPMDCTARHDGPDHLGLCDAMRAPSVKCP